MFNMFCRCEKQVEFENIVKRLECLQSQQRVFQENINQVIYQMTQLQVMVRGIVYDESVTRKMKTKKNDHTSRSTNTSESI